MKIIFLIILGTLCSCTKGSTPTSLNDAPCPIVLVAKSKEGVLLRDGNGHLYNYEASYYIAKTIIESDLKSGDELSPNCK